MNYELSPRLNRVEIDNWGTIQHEIIEFSSDFTCMFGDSGSGKTTIIDAIQYALTAARKFNSSSNGDDRSVKRYVRGNSDSEGGNQYLRSGYVTSYIILEFYMPAEINNKYLTVGVCIESPSNNDSCSSSWFILPHTNLSDLNTTEKNGETIKFSNKNDLKSKGVRITDFYTGRKAIEQIRRVLGIKGGDMFSHIFMKMISCKPEANGNTFLRESFLQPYEINSIETIRERRKAIFEIKHNFDELHQEAQVLEQMLNAKYDAEKASADLCEAKMLLDYQGIVQLEKEIKSLEERIIYLTKKISNVSSSIEECKLNIESIENEIESISSSDEEEKLRYLENRIIQIKQNISNNRVAYNKLVKLSDLLKSSGSFLMEEYDPENRDRVLKRLDSDDIESSIIAERLSAFLDFVAAYNQDITNQIADISITLSEEQKELSEVSEKLNTLNRGDKVYPKEVMEAYKIAANFIADKGDNRKITTVSDAVLEFVDDQWSSAIEAVLGNNRYGILVSEEDCVELKDFLVTKGITNVPVVMINELTDTVVAKGSASEQLVIKDIDCRNFLYPILNRIYLCNSSSEIENHLDGGLTCEGIYAFEKAVQKLDLRSVNSCLGKNSILIQKQHYAVEKKQIEDSIIAHSNQHRRLMGQQAIIRKVDVDIEGYDCSAIVNANTYEEELHSLQAKLIELRNTPELIQTEAIKREYVEAKKKMQAELENLVGTNAKLNNNLELSNEEKAKKKFSLGILIRDFETKNEESIRIKIKSLYESRVSDRNGGEVITEAICRKYEDEWREKLSDFEDLKRDYKALTGKAIYSMDDSAINTRYKAIKNEEYAELNQKLIEANKSFADLFINKFVIEIGECIVKAKNVASEVNGTLKNMKFGSDSYKFIIENNPEQKEFFELLERVSIMNDNVSLIKRDPNLEHDMEVFMARILDEERDEYYSDYRNYVNCRMKIITRDGDQEIVADFESKQRSASVGEKHTPYYVILIASLVSCYKNEGARDIPSMRLVLIDEAFISISGERIDQLLELMHTYGLQVIFAAVPDKLYGIIEQCDAQVAVIKQGRYTKVVDGRFNEND